MPQVSVEDTQVAVTLSTREHLLTLTGSFEVPLKNVTGAQVFDNEEPLPWWRVGTHFPGVFRAGRFRGDGKHYFIFHRTHRSAVDIALADERFDRLIIDVEDPQALVTQLTR